MEMQVVSEARNNPNPRPSGSVFSNNHSQQCDIVIDTSLEAYDPPQHLIASSGLVKDELVSQFDEFKASLCFTSAAPELVFERVLANAFVTSEVRRNDSARHPEPQVPSVSFGSSLATNVEQPIRIQYENIASDCAGVDPRSLPTPDIPFDPAAAPVKFTLVKCLKGFGVRAAPKSSNQELYNASCSWSEVQYAGGGIQYGSYNTIQGGPAPSLGPLKSWHEGAIHFDTPYRRTPKVHVWLAGFDMRCPKQWRLKTFATDITRTGFIIVIESFDDDILYSAGVSWLASDFDSNDVVAANFRVAARRLESCDNVYEFRSMENVEEMNFLHWRVMVGITELVHSGGACASVTVQVGDTGENYIQWLVEGAKEEEGTIFDQLEIIYVLHKQPK